MTLVGVIFPSFSSIKWHLYNFDLLIMLGTDTNRLVTANLSIFVNYDIARSPLKVVLIARFRSYNPKTRSDRAQLDKTGVAPTSTKDIWSKVFVCCTD